MRKLQIALLFALSAAALAFADYDKEAVVKAMRENGAFFGRASTAANQKDYAEAARSLEGLAKSTEPLLAMDPPKGTKEEWKAAVEAFLKAVRQGAEAGKNKDEAGLKTAMAEIRKQMQSSHAKFK